MSLKRFLVAGVLLVGLGIETIRVCADGGAMATLAAPIGPG
jgi:hypothetical protein